MGFIFSNDDLRFFKPVVSIYFFLVSIFCLRYMVVYLCIRLFRVGLLISVTLYHIAFVADFLYYLLTYFL